MSIPVTRVGDIGEGAECAAPGNNHRKYTATYVTGAGTVYANNIAVTTITSVADQTCGHSGQAVTGSATVFVENLAIHRIGDIGEGGAGDTYDTVTGSPDVYAG